MAVMQIMPPEVSYYDGLIRVSSEIRMPTGTEVLWFECNARFGALVDTQSCDAFVVAMLFLAMREGWDVEVCGPMSSRLYYNLSHYYTELYRHCAPGLQRVNVQAQQLTRECHGGAGVITGFSAGVDSYSTLADHAAGRVPPEYQITHLLLNNVGAFGRGEHSHDIFADRQRRLEPLAQELGLELVAVNSNLNALLASDFQLSHVARNASVGLLLQKGIGKYVYSAAYHYRDCKVIPTPAYGDADALLVPMLSTESLECIESGAQFTRFDKTALIADLPSAQRNLDVCVLPAMAPAGKPNCSICWKCLRTELTLDVLGKLDRFSDVFDAAAFRRNQWLYLCHVAGSPKPMAADIRTGMARQGYQIPLSARIVAALLPVALIETAVIKWPSRGRLNPLYLAGLIVARYLATPIPVGMRKSLAQRFLQRRKT